MPMRSVDRVQIGTDSGITGDRYENARHRQVTVQSQEEIGLAEAELGREIDPALTRRNITISAGLLNRTPGAEITIGQVRVQVVRDAAPCKLLEDTLGRDAKLALHKRAGVVCRTLTGGEVAIGDAAELCETRNSDRH